MPRCVSLFVAIIFLAPQAWGQSDPQAWLKAYQAERKVSEERFPAAALAPADALAAKAEKQIASDPELAIRQFREARWQLPYSQPGLPEHVSRVLGACRLRHSDRVNALAYGPDGFSLLSASRDGTVKRWDLGSGRERWVYRGLADLGPAEKKEISDDVLRASSVVWSKSNVIACCGYGQIHLLDPENGQVVKVLKGHEGTVKALDFRPDGKKLVSLGDDKTIRIWDVATAKELVNINLAKQLPGQAAPQLGRFEAVSYAPKGDQVAAVNQDGRLVVYDVSGKTPVLKMGASIVNGSSSLLAVKYTPDGTGLYTSGELSNPPRLTAGPPPDAEAPPANPMAGPVPAVRSFIGHTKRVTCLDISPDGTLLVTGSEDDTCRVWEANTAKSLKQFAAHASQICAVAIRPDGKEVASADETGIIRIWPLGAVDEHSVSKDAGDAVWTLAMNASGTKYAVGGSDKLIRVYDSTNGKLLRTLQGHKAALSAMAFLDDDTLASAGGDRNVLIWNLKAEESPRVLSGHTSVLLSLAPFDGGRKLITGSVDRSIRLWDIATGKQLGSYDAKSAVSSISSRKGSSQIVAGTLDGWVNLIDVADSSFKLVASAAAHTLGTSAVALKPDGKEFVSVGGDGVVQVWQLNDKKELVAKETYEAVPNPSGNGPYTLSCVVYSADGKQFAVAGQEGLVRIYDTNTRREIRTLRGNTDWVTAISFTPDGKTLLTSSVDRAIRRFPLAEADIAPVPGHLRAATCLAVSPDGKTAVTVSTEELKRWDLASGKELGTVSLQVLRQNAVVYAAPNVVVMGGDGNKLNWVDLAEGKTVRSEPVAKSIYSLISNGKDTVGVWQNKLDSTEIVFWNAGKFGVPYPLPGATPKPERQVLCAAMAPDGSFAVAGQDNKNVLVIDLVTRKQVDGDWPLYSASPVDISLTADHSRVVCVDSEGTIKVGTVADRKVTATAKAHPKGCNAIILARSGDRFATIGADGEIKAWNMEAKELRSWRLPVEVKSAVYAPDGRSIMTANGDGSSFVLAVP